MPRELLFLLLADAVLVLHAAIVAFIVGGLFFIIAGNIRGWRLAGHLWFRLAHLTAIGIVVTEAWLGVDCPLTIVEMRFREMAGASGYEGSFIAYWLQQLLFYTAPPWMFTVAYSCFGFLVFATWWRFPPRWKHPQRKPGSLNH